MVLTVLPFASVSSEDPSATARVLTVIVPYSHSTISLFDNLPDCYHARAWSERTANGKYLACRSGLVSLRQSQRCCSSPGSLMKFSKENYNTLMKLLEWGFINLPLPP